MLPAKLTAETLDFIAKNMKDGPGVPCIGAIATKPGFFNAGLFAGVWGIGVCGFQSPV